MKITSAHGSGGRETSKLIEEVFARYLGNPILNRMEDSAVVEGAGRLAMTTDSFVVTPLFFPGGDIGTLSVCGTVNDLLMSGAVPKYLTCGFILEEGADTEALEKIAVSMAETAKRAGVMIVTGDTKVIEGSGGIYINTAGVGFVPEDCKISASNCQAGDSVIVSGYMGDHHAAILSSRMEFTNSIVSDCAPLTEMVSRLMKEEIGIKAMRDVTRGGLGTVLNEFAKASRCCVELHETCIPVREEVKGFCGILGLDPLYMGNEGKMVLVVNQADENRALDVMRSSVYGEHAAVIGTISHEEDGAVLLHTKLGGRRIVTELYGEGLPRIC